MKLAVHWRVALWNAFLIGFAFLVFGVQMRTVVFASVALIVGVYIVIHLRSKIIRPLAELSDLFEPSPSPGGHVRFPIVRNEGEVRRLIDRLENWSQSIGTRMKELSDARLRLESILSAVGEGVLVFDRDHRILLANDAFGKILEVAGEPVGKTCLEVFRNERLDRSVQQVFGGEAPKPVEFQTGSGLTVRALLAPVRDGVGADIKAVVSIFHDVTDIRHVDTVRRDFVANVSHEFKTPLTSIRGYAETLLSESGSASDREYANIIYRNARYLDSLVNDLLELARLESDLPSASEHMDVKSVVDEQVRLRERSPTAVPLKIAVDCPSIELRADRVRVSTAVSNLIDNAIRYNRPGREVRISARREGSYVVVAVSDGGFGIPDRELSRIFERFYRVDKARTRNGRGTGLGLAIARHAVESQGGTLTVESKVGSGSTFTIRLPATVRGA